MYAASSGLKLDRQIGTPVLGAIVEQNYLHKTTDVCDGFVDVFVKIFDVIRDVSFSRVLTLQLLFEEL